jgi:uronate dehydrogenase/NAD+ dependent glucose-6-phosphate dehydrogenase
MADTKKVLVTGMSGLIGGIVGRHLASLGHEVRALNRQSVEGFECVQADITDYDAIRPAFDGIDTVVHLAAYLGPDDQSQIDVNITGTYNVFEAAGDAGVKRVVFGSSGAVMMAAEKHEPIKSMIEARLDDIPDPRPVMLHTDPPRPERMYGVAKVAGEAMARLFSENHGSAIVARIGRVRAEDRPANAREAAVHFSHRDVAQFFEKCVEAPDDVKWDVFYGVSDNFTRFRDIAHAREVIGYVPRDGIKSWPLSSQN